MSHRYELKSENKGATDQALDFPKLTLKKGEVARLALFSIQEVDGKKSLTLPVPEGGYFFGIRKADGTFAGSYECIAPDEVKDKDEFDPDTCPHCKAALEGAPEDIIEGRRRRFVMPVVRYRTAPGKPALTQPFSVECVAWTFTDRYFNTLVDEHEKWSESGGLLGHDVSLFCEVEQYQTYKLSVEPQAAYKGDKELTKLVFATYAAGVEMAPTLRRKLGQTLTKDQMEAKINEALRIAGMVEAGAAGQQVTAQDMASIEGLADELFGGATPVSSEPAQEAPVAAEAVSVEEVSEAAPVAQEAVPTVSEDSSGETADELDFDQFFSQSKS